MSRCAALARPRSVRRRGDEVQAWALEWERGPGADRCAWSTGRWAAGLVGANQLPGRAWVDGYAEAWELLGARRQVGELGTELADRAKASCPRGVVPWVERNPVKVLQLAADWDEPARHASAGSTSTRHRRHVPAPGRRASAWTPSSSSRHKGVLAELLDLQLDPDAGRPCGA